MNEEMKARKEKLFSAKKNGYDRMQASEELALARYCDLYKDFLARCKTERECVSRTIALAEAAGFRPYERGM